MPAATTRLATAADLPFVHQTLYLALAWDPNDLPPPLETVVVHPEVARYHVEWMRAGDAGVVAEVEGEFAGLAYYRLFTENDHGYGYLDPATPEMAIGVVPEQRGRGIGTRLIDELAEFGRQTGLPRISLSVSKRNPAARLYERCGYRYVSVEDEGLMVLDLD